MKIYLNNETNFERNGLGFLTNCISATITESLNGDYYLEFEYPVNDKMSDYIVEENIVECHSQLFRIKKVTKKYDKLTVYAYHIFYDLLDNFILDTYPQNLNAGSFGQWILDKTNFETNFTFYSDIGTLASARYIRKNPVEIMLGDIDNSMINLFGGELERDNFNIKLLANRGTNRGVKLLFAKNIKDITITTDITSMYTRIIPVGYDGLLLPEKYVDSPLIDNYPTPKIGMVEFSNIKYDETGEDGYSTLEEAYQALRDAVNELYNNGTDKPQINVKVDWVELSKTEQYKNFKAIETVNIGDTISANILGLDYTTKVTKTTYNALTDTIEKFEIGTLQKSIANTVNSQTNLIQEINPTSILDDAKKTASSLITSAMGGYVYKTNNELYIMDTNDPSTAQKVWRWNINGLGYSSTGVNGTYEVAMTSDGKINADMITTGKINTNLIEGYGSLVLQVSKKVDNDAVISTINQSAEQITLSSNRLVVNSDGFELDGEGNMTATSGKIAGFEIDSDNGFVYNIYAKYDYTDDDLTTIKEIIMQGTTPTSEQLEKYDINEDGIINAVDYGVIANFVKYGITTTTPGKFEITTAKKSVLESKVGYFDSNGEIITGFNYNSMFLNKKSVLTGQIFSYGEKEIGTWIDGKNLCSITLQATVSSNTTSQIDLTYLEYDTAWIDMGASFSKYAGNNTSSPVNWWNNSSSDYGLCYINANSVLNIKNISPNTRDYYITINYTKNE